MKNILNKIFKKKISSSGNEIVQTTPLSEDQIQAGAPDLKKPRPFQLVISCGQSLGVQRDNNEDSIYSFSSVISTGIEELAFGLCIVADGMGGYKNGELASSVCTKVAAKYLISKVYTHLLDIHNDPLDESIQETVLQAIKDAQKAVVLNAPGGGTTLTMAMIIGEQVTIAHVGDSRAYFIYPDGRIHRVSKDHSLVQRMVDLEEITETEAFVHPQRNILLQAIGQTETFKPDIVTHQIPKGGYLMLCSDGLWGVLPDQEMYRIIISTKEPSEACIKLVDAANRAGGPDNISVVLVKFPGG